MTKPMTSKATPLASPDAYRQRFHLTHHPLPRNSAGESFFPQTPGFCRLESQFQELLEEPGLGLLVGEAGIGKTAAIRHLCGQLPNPDYKVIYLCDTASAPCDVYRTLALELGLEPSHRKAQLWWDIKARMAGLIDEQHTVPVIIVDEAQHLSDRFLADLAGFLNFAFDTRSLATLWLIGLPSLARRLRMQIHAPLLTRVVAQVQMLPFERESFRALVEHGLRAAGTRDKLLTDTAQELLFRASRGIPRIASRILRAALQRAHMHNQNIVDDAVLKDTLDELSFAEEVKP